MKSEKKEKELGARGRLADATIDRLQNYAGVAIRQIVGYLKSMKSGFLTFTIHIALLAQIIGANIMLIEQITLKLIN